MPKIVYVGIIVVFGIICLAVIFNVLNNNDKKLQVPIIQNVSQEEETDNQKKIIKKKKSNNKVIIVSIIIIFFIAIIGFLFCYFFFWKNNKKNEEKKNKDKELREINKKKDDEEKKINEKKNDEEKKIEAQILYGIFKESMMRIFRKGEFDYLIFQRNDKKIIGIQKATLPLKNEKSDENKKTFLKESGFGDYKEIFWNDDLFFIVSSGLIHIFLKNVIFNDEKNFRESIKNKIIVNQEERKKIISEKINSTHVFFMKKINEKDKKNKFENNAIKAGVVEKLRGLFEDKGSCSSPKENFYEGIKEIKEDSYPIVCNDGFYETSICEFNIFEAFLLIAKDYKEEYPEIVKYFLGFLFYDLFIFLGCFFS